MSGARLLDQRRQHVSATGTGRSEVRERDIEVVKVKRYWPGKPPEWASDPVGAPEPQAETAARTTAGTPSRPEAQVLSRACGGALSSAEAAVDEEEEEDDDIDARRERARAQRAREAAEEGGGEDCSQSRSSPGGDGESESDSGSESEDESDDGGGSSVPRPGSALQARAKPVFVPRPKRATVHEQEREEQRREAEEKRRIARLAERRKDTLNLVVEQVRRDLEGDGREDTNADMPDDADGQDEAAEYGAWELRELRRIRKDREERAAAARERAEIDRRRNLTDEERVREDQERLAAEGGAEEDKGQWKFLQKYYHKGAFFQGEDDDGKPVLGDIMKRDYGSATGGDKGVDKANLPKVMQVKKFGFRSQVKWTHLSAEDTTDRDAIMAARRAQRDLGQGRVPSDGLSRPSAKRAKL